MAPPPPPSTLFSADLPSEDEEDGDFVAPASPASSSSSTAGRKTTKRQKLLHSPEPQQVEDAPKAFSYSDLVQTSASAQAEQNGASARATDQVAMVTIRVQRKFAGEILYEEVTVPSTSPEAQALLASSANMIVASTSQPSDPSGTDVPAVKPTSPASASQLPPPVSTSLNPDPSLAPPPPPRPPARAPPKKKRASALEASATVVKPKKMTTLEKSALDWKAASAQLKEEERDELERNRRKGGAGYLEKMDFLGRVGDRLDGSSSSTGQGRRS